MKGVLLMYLSRCLGRFLKDRSFCVRTRYGWPISVRPGKGPTELSMFLVRSFASEISNLVTVLLPNGGTFVDIGAHIGWFSKLASYKVGPLGLVIAVEPEPSNFEMLKSNLQNVPSEIILAQVALGDTCQRRKLYLGSSAEHSLIKIKNQSIFVLVDVVTGDSLFANYPKVDLVKVDVEGAELEVLKGMRRCLERWEEAKVIVEFLAKDLTFDRIREFHSFTQMLGFNVYFIQRLSPLAKRLPRLYAVPLEKWASLPFQNVLLTRGPVSALSIVRL